jgi:hypothetical protein
MPWSLLVAIPVAIPAAAPERDGYPSPIEIGLVAALACGLSLACSDAGVISADARIESFPADAADAVAVGTWPELRIQPADAAVGVTDLALVCGEKQIPVRIHRPSGGRIVVQPEHRLPTERTCRLSWSRAGRGESIGFTTFRASAAPGRSLYVLYRRANPGEIAPIPDDFWTVPDPGTVTGLRLELPVALRSDVREVVEGLRSELSQADGWSPIGPIVIPISDRIDPSSIPRTVAESLDPTSTIALVDVDPESSERGERWPFEVVLRRDRTSIGVEDHALWVLPARPLRPGGRYALLVRRGVATSAGRSMIEPAPLRSIFDREANSAIGVGSLIAEQLAPALEVSVDPGRSRLCARLHGQKPR